MLSWWLRYGPPATLALILVGMAVWALVAPSQPATLSARGAAGAAIVTPTPAEPFVEVLTYEFPGAAPVALLLSGPARGVSICRPWPQLVLVEAREGRRWLTKQDAAAWAGVGLDAFDALPNADSAECKE
jgi:hypothetical protein